MTGAPRPGILTGMRFAAFGVILLLVGNAHAESTAPAPALDTTRRDVGTGLSVGGLVLGSVGAGMFFLTRPSGDDSCGCASRAWVFPTVLMSVGGAMTLTGVPLWITGQMKLDRATTRAELQLGPLGGSVRVLF
ncbi:putative membrane protein [Sorangium cellulosum So ce56]|uniref:Membrane protein n=2 Tax=Sorangium cellulosum TaxID=56 RepID=A9GH21_SORC5|nr:putative membrane protein [Sorangium cellulosum So ce56]